MNMKEFSRLTLGRRLPVNLAQFGNYNFKRVFDFSYKWKMPSWKVKGVDRVFNAMDGSLIDRNN